MENLEEIIKSRRSVRTFDGKAIDKEKLNKLKEYSAKIENPFGIKVKFLFLNAKQNSLSSPVIVGEDYYILAVAPKIQRMEEAVGYSFEQLLLYAWSIGLGSVWIGGTMDRKAFESAANLSSDERMPCISPLGVTAKKMSAREKLMRKGIKADNRMEWKDLFFNKDFNSALTENEAGDLRFALEMVRLAPSAVNRQPWRIVVDGDNIHFYQQSFKGMISEAVGDMQRIDIGIAMNHFVLALNQTGVCGQFVSENPNIESPDNTDYVITFKIER